MSDRAWIAVALSVALLSPLVYLAHDGLSGIDFLTAALLLAFAGAALARGFRE